MLLSSLSAFQDSELKIFKLDTAYHFFTLDYLVIVNDWEAVHGILSFHVYSLIIAIIILGIPNNSSCLGLHHRTHYSKILASLEFIVEDFPPWYVLFAILVVMILKNLWESYDIEIIHVDQRFLNKAKLNSCCLQHLPNSFACHIV